MQSKRLMEELVKDYAEKLFYFCLKKTGQHYDAEDLCSEILLCVMESLNKGMVPEHFSAYVWQVARNQYARWAENKQRKSKAVTGSDIGDYELEDTRENTEDELIRREELALLRRELAFISAEYRNLLVAYYLKNKSVREIVLTTGLPKGTVESKLHRGRNILKVAMNMAREFGVRSYNPEEITFVNNCSAFGENGQPWSILRHGLYKNIFLEAYNNPSTAEELSLELGVALPYMEEELQFLASETFLVKTGNKYETDFPIISRETQEKIAERNVTVTAKITSLLEKLIDTFHGACEKTGTNYSGGYVSYEDAKWTLLMMVVDRYRWSNTASVVYRERPNNGKWEIVGYQNTNLPCLPWVGQHGCFPSRNDLPDIHFSQFKFLHGNIQARTPEYLCHEDGYALKLVAEGKWQNCDKTALENLLGFGYIRAEGEGYVPNVLVFKNCDTDKLWNSLSEEDQEKITTLSEQLKTLFKELVAYSNKITKNDLPSRFRENENLCSLACRSTGVDRSDVLEQAVKDGWLKLDENTGKTVGAFLYL